MESSGRWQVGVHAGDGHVLIRVDAGGRAGPFYANELWAHGQRESFAAYKRRVANDLKLGATLLARNLPGKSHDTFAVPFGNYGQYGSISRRIEPWFVRYLKRHFAVSFVQHDHSFTREGQRFGNRIAVGSRCDAHTLEMRLRQGLEQLEKSRRQAAKTRVHPR